MAAKTDRERIRVALVDDSRLSCQLLADALSKLDIEITAMHSNSQEFLSCPSGDALDVLLISSDLDNKPGRGCEVLKSLRRGGSSFAAIVLVEQSDRATVVDAFRAGARGVFCRRENISNLRKSIECVHNGQIWADREQLGYVLDALSTAPWLGVHKRQEANLLSNREFEVVQCLAEGLTNREIAQRLRLSSHTVKNYLFRIFDKVGVSSRVELLFLFLDHAEGIAQRETSSSEDPFQACRRDAERGSPIAQLRLAEMYAEGRLVHRDLAKACAWILSAEKGVNELAGQIRAAQSKVTLAMAGAEGVRGVQKTNLKPAGRAETKPLPGKVMPMPALRLMKKVSTASRI